MRALTPCRALLVVLMAAVFAAGLVAAEVAQAHAMTATAPAARSLVAEPDPPGPLPSQQPWIEAPQLPPGTPVNPNPSQPPPGTISGPGKVCQGKTKLKTRPFHINPQILCEVSPGKWVPMDYDTVEPIPGQKFCQGKQKQVMVPGAPLPDTWCEVSPGKWVQDPSSPYKLLGNPNAGKDCSPIDISCQAGEAVTGWFKDLVESARKPAFNFLSATILGTPEIKSKNMERPREIWGTSQLIANTCFVLIISITGIMIMAGQSLPGEMSPRELLARVMLAFLASNLSLILIGYGIEFANGLARAFLAAGGSKIDPAQAGKVLGAGVEASINTMGIFFILLALVAVILSVVVAFIYVARLAITMVLIAAAPLALMFHALPMTDGIAKLWWRGITGMLAIQVLQSLVLVTALQVLFAETSHKGSFVGVPTTKADAIDLLLVICLLWVMIRIPSWVSRSIWRSAQPRLLGQIVKSFLVYRTVGAALSTLGRVTRGGRPPGGGRHRGGPGPFFGGGGPRGSGGGRGGGGGPRHTPGGNRPHGTRGHGPGSYHGRPPGGYHTGYGQRAHHDHSRPHSGGHASHAFHTGSTGNGGPHATAPPVPRMATVGAAHGTRRHAAGATVRKQRRPRRIARVPRPSRHVVLRLDPPHRRGGDR